LHAGDFEAFAAAHIFTGHQVILAQHIGAGFGKAGTVALVGAPGKLALLGAHYPRDFVLSGLVAVGTVQRGCLLFGAFVKKISFFNGNRRWSLVIGRGRIKRFSARGSRLSNHGN
jgi:hypothetical protein